VLHAFFVSLRELDLSAFSPHLAASAHHYLLCVEGAYKYAQRESCLDFAHITYVSHKTPVFIFDLRSEVSSVAHILALLLLFLHAVR